MEKYFYIIHYTTCFFEFKEGFTIGKKHKNDDNAALAPPFFDCVSSIDKPRIVAGLDIPEEMIQEIEDSGLYMGLETGNGKGYYVGKKSEDDGNALIIGTNGSGKSYFLAKSMIETWKDPFVALDCKGELSEHYRILKHRGKVSREYLVFDPLNDGVHYDPYAILKKDASHFIQNVREIAFSLIPQQNNDPNSYWINMARDLLSAVIVHGFSSGLDFIETMLIAAKLPVAELCRQILRSDSSDAQMFISEIAGLKKEQQAAIGTDLKQHLMVFATDPYIQEALCSNENKITFSWDDIVAADDAPNIFLKLDQDRLEQWSSMTQLMLTQLIRTMERRPDKHAPEAYNMKPILALLDEFPLLGKMDAIKNALTTLRSKKVTFCLMIQSIAQLDEVYGQNTRKIIVDNCQYKIILNISEPDSQEYFSNLIGSVPIGRRSITQNCDPFSNRITYARQIQEFREPWVLPHEFATNKDIWLHTPHGFLSTIKLPVSATHKHVFDFGKIIQIYRRQQQ